MGVIKIIIKKLNNAIFKHNISEIDKVITFLCWSYAISKSGVARKSSIIKCFCACESKIANWAIYTNFQNDITKLYFFWKNFKKSSNLIAIVTGKNNRRSIFAIVVYIKSNLRIAIEKSLQFVYISYPRWGHL